MARRPGAASSSAASTRKPQTLDTYVRAAIDANTLAPPTKPRRRRKKHQQEAATGLPPALEAKAAVPPAPPPLAKPKRRKRQSKVRNSALQRRKAPPSGKFRVRGLVTADELEDEDEAEAVQEEVRADFGRFGELRELAIVVEKEDEGRLAGDVVVTFEEAANAASAFSAYDGNVFGGKTVACFWETQSDGSGSSVVVANDMTTPAELQDPDEVADAKEEMEQIFRNHGEVGAADGRNAENVVQAMNDRRGVTARLEHSSGDAHGVKHPPDMETRRVATPTLQPTESPPLKELVGSLLKRLAALQKRAHTQNKAAKRSRRLVLGMHEVRRGLLCNKIVLLVIATDLDRCEAVEEKYAELVTIATEHQVPVLALMNRRKLGRVLQKSVRVSCVGVYSVEGANDLFHQILQNVSCTPTVK